jgi:L-asparagine transporter-like permease
MKKNFELIASILAVLVASGIATMLVMAIMGSVNTLSPYAQKFSDYCTKAGGILNPETPGMWGQCLMPSGVMVQEQQIISFLIPDPPVPPGAMK